MSALALIQIGQELREGDGRADEVARLCELCLQLVCVFAALRAGTENLDDSQRREQALTARQALEAAMSLTVGAAPTAGGKNAAHGDIEMLKVDANLAEIHLALQLFAGVDRSHKTGAAANVALSVDRFVAQLFQRLRQIRSGAGDAPTHDFVGGTRRGRETADVQGAFESYFNDAQDLQAFMAKFRALQAAIDRGDVETEQDVQDEMAEIVKHTGDSFQVSASQIASMFWKRHLAEQAVAQANSAIAEARRSIVEGQEHIREANANLGQAEIYESAADAHLDQLRPDDATNLVGMAGRHTAIANELVAQAETAFAESGSHSDRGENLLAAARAHQSQALKLGELVRMGPFGADLEPLLSQNEQRSISLDTQIQSALSSLTSVRADIASGQISVDETKARATSSAARIEQLKARIDEVRSTIEERMAAQQQRISNMLITGDAGDGGGFGWLSSLFNLASSSTMTVMPGGLLFGLADIVSELIAGDSLLDLAQDGVIDLIFEEFGDELQEQIREVLETHVPVGSRFHLDASGSLTPLIPIRISAGSSVSIEYLGDGKVQLVRTTNGRVGVDTGIGIGFMVGRAKKDGTSAGGHSIGFLAGADATAGLSVSIRNTYVFDLNSPGGAKAMLRGLVRDAWGEAAEAGGNFAVGDDPLGQFHTSMKMELAVDASASAMAMAGYRNATEGANTKQRTTNQGEAMDMGQGHSNPVLGVILRSLGANASAIVGLGGNASVEVNKVPSPEPGGGMCTAYTLSFEGGGVASAQLSLPVAGGLGIGGEVVAGIKFTVLELDPTAENLDKRFSKPTASLLTKSGDMDSWRGSASEVEFSVPLDALGDLLTFGDVPTVVEQGAINVKWRVGVSSVFGRGLKQRLAQQKYARALQSEGTNFGLMSQALIDLEIAVDEQLFKAVSNALTSGQDGASAKKAAQSLLSTGDITSDLLSKVDETGILEAFKIITESAKRADLVFDGGLDFAASVKVAKGAKVRLEGQFTAATGRRVNLKDIDGIKDLLD